MLRIASHIAADAPEIYGASSKLDRQREAKLRAEGRRDIEQAAEGSSQHRVAQGARGVFCQVCHGRPTADIPKLQWLGTPCQGVSLRLDPSHKLMRHRGFFWCRVCGGVGAKMFCKLGKPCNASHPITKHGDRAIRALEDSRLPPGYKEWPQPDDLEPPREVIL